MAHRTPAQERGILHRLEVVLEVALRALGPHDLFVRPVGMVTEQKGFAGLDTAQVVEGRWVRVKDEFQAACPLTILPGLKCALPSSWQEVTLVASPAHVARLMLTDHRERKSKFNLSPGIEWPMPLRGGRHMWRPGLEVVGAIVLLELLAAGGVKGGQNQVR